MARRRISSPLATALLDYGVATTRPLTAEALIRQGTLLRIVYPQRPSGDDEIGKLAEDLADKLTQAVDAIVDPDDLLVAQVALGTTEGLAKMSVTARYRQLGKSKRWYYDRVKNVAEQVARSLTDELGLELTPLAEAPIDKGWLPGKHFRDSVRDLTVYSLAVQLAGDQTREDRQRIPRSRPAKGDPRRHFPRPEKQLHRSLPGTWRTATELLQILVEVDNQVAMSVDEVAAPALPRPYDYGGLSFLLRRWWSLQHIVERAAYDVSPRTLRRRVSWRHPWLVLQTAVAIWPRPEMFPLTSNPFTDALEQLEKRMRSGLELEFGQEDVAADVREIARQIIRP